MNIKNLCLLTAVMSLMFTFPYLGCKDSWAKIQNFTVNGDHGKLSGILQTPDNLTEYPLVMIFHGFNSRKEMPLLQNIADELDKNGIASVRFDFNGHGQSEGNFVDMTIPNELEDARKVYEYVKTLPNISSVSLTGHSQGGVVASMLAGELGEDEIKSVVLLAPAAVLKDMARDGNLFGIRYDTNNLPDYVEIPGCCKVGKKYVKTAHALPIYETSALYKGPVLIIHGTADDIVPYSYGVKYDEIYKNGKLESLDGVNHLFGGHIDEVANDAGIFIKEQTLQ